MRKQYRYGDEETIVTLRERAVAVLFVIGISALLIGPVVRSTDESPGRMAQSAATAEVGSGTAPASVPAETERSTHQAQSEAP